MKLWLLKPVEGLPSDYKANPWELWYDKAFGFVIRAETEADARKIANENQGQEGRVFMDDRPWDEQEVRHPWLDSHLSTCMELTPDGEAGLILEDYAQA